MENKVTIRLDKFLWCVRLCKTRNISYNLCKKNKIKINDIIAKPSKKVNIDDIVKINKNHIFFEYEILKLLNKRVSAALIKNYIKDITPLEELDKLKIKNIYPVVFREKGQGRPTKKERRILKKNKLINK